MALEVKTKTRRRELKYKIAHNWSKMSRRVEVDKVPSSAHFFLCVPYHLARYSNSKRRDSTKSPVCLLPRRLVPRQCYRARARIMNALDLFSCPRTHLRAACRLFFFFSFSFYPLHLCPCRQCRNRNCITTHDNCYHIVAIWELNILRQTLLSS